MNNDLETSFEKLLGRAPTNADKQALYRIRDALGLKNNDALWLVLIALQSYNEQYKAIPVQIEKAAKASADSAAQQAQEQISKAVATLVPTVKKSVEKAATSAVKRVQWGTSMLSIWAGILGLSFFFALGWILGSGVYEAARTQDITWTQFWHLTSSGIGLGVVVTGLLALSVINEEMKRWQWATLAAAIAGISLLVTKWCGAT